MNILIDELPTKIEVNNHIYSINANFKNCLRIMEAFEDNELTNTEKIYIMLDLLYETMPEDSDLEMATKQGIKFLDCGEELNDEKRRFEEEYEIEEKSERLYSFKKDAKYIYSAIQQTHSIDLEQISFLHWWKFIYLFLDLNKDCFFSQMLYLRKQKQKGKLSKEERITYYQMREILDLEYIPEDEREKSEFETLLEAGEKQ